MTNKHIIITTLLSWLVLMEILWWMM